MATSEVRFLETGSGDKTIITGFEAVFKTKKDLTGDLEDYFVLTVPPGAGAPLHVHHKNDETLHVIEGTFTFQIEEKVMNAPNGAFVYIPRGVPHKFTNTGASSGRMVGTFTPAGTFDFFDALTKIAPGDVDEIDAVNKKYGHELLEAGIY
jgi:mannose-6-phosphate isomerase-like protein (cupin superfamily)